MYIYLLTRHTLTVSSTATSRCVSVTSRHDVITTAVCVATTKSSTQVVGRLVASINVLVCRYSRAYVQWALSHQSSSSWSAASAAAAAAVVYSAAICAYIELNCAHLSKSMKLVHMYSTEVADQHQLLIQDRNCIWRHLWRQFFSKWPKKTTSERLYLRN